MDEFRSRGNPLYKSYYTYDAVGNRLKIKRYDYRQDCNGKFNDTAITEEAVPETVDITGQISTDDDLTLDEADSTYVIQDIRMLEDTDLALQALETADPENGLASLDPVVNDVALPSLEETDAWRDSGVHAAQRNLRRFPARRFENSAPSSQETLPSGGNYHPWAFPQA